MSERSTRPDSDTSDWHPEDENEMERERIWPAIAKEAAKTIGERARHRFVSGNSSGNPLMGCGVLLGVFFAFSLVMSIAAAVESILENILGVIVSAVALYVAVFVIVSVLSPVIDWLRRSLSAYQSSRQTAMSIRRSPFPRSKFLRNQHCNDLQKLPVRHCIVAKTALAAVEIETYHIPDGYYAYWSRNLPAEILQKQQERLVPAHTEIPQTEPEPLQLKEDLPENSPWEF